MKSWLVILCGTYILCGYSEESIDVYIVTPNDLRLGSEETIGVAIDNARYPQLLEILVQDHPGRVRNLSRTNILVSPGKPEILKLIIGPEHVMNMQFTDSTETIHVCLIVHGNEFHKEAVIPLSTKSGYVFVQTDKPIYTPKQKVKFRIIAFKEEGKLKIENLRLQIRNPQNMVVRDTQLDSSNSFITPEPFAFSENSLLGQWSAIALYGHEQNVTVKFDVMEYVLPRFKMKLYAQEVILPSTTLIPIFVTAKYLYGKPVIGSVSLRLGIKDKKSEVNFVANIGSRQLKDGTASVNVSTRYLKQGNQVHWFPEGSRLIVEASVIDKATGIKEVAVNDTGIFTSSPLIISFKRSLKDFKPGLTSVIEAEVMHVNGRPAAGIRTVLNGIANINLPLKIYTTESISSEDGRIRFVIHPEKDHHNIHVTVKTDDPKYKGKQAVGHHFQREFLSKNKAYIAINRRSQETIRPGNSFSEDIYIESNGHPIADIYFTVTSRGIIVLMDKLPKGHFKNVRIEFLVTYQMAPSFRITVFGHCNGELMADSRRVDVTNECEPTSRITIEPKFPTNEPGTNGTIVLHGNKYMKIGLLGVDSGVYALSDRGLLTRSKMFKTMEKRDRGCGPGGGWTTQEVLANAGILIFTKHYSSSPDLVPSCKVNIRKKRQLECMIPQKHSEILSKCCALGMKNDMHDRSCEERANLVQNTLDLEGIELKEDERNCSKVFLQCCDCKKNTAGPFRFAKLEMLSDAMIISPLNLDVSYALEDNEEEEEETLKNANIREEFQETWIFEDFITGLDGKVEYDVSLPHSITTWVIQAVSLSQNRRMCVATPQKIRSFKKMFIQLNLPYSVIRNEQIEIKATVFNYGAEVAKVRVYMFGVKDLCSGYQEGERSERKNLTIESQSAKSVSFPVIPLKEGKYSIKIAAISNNGGSDVVVRQLYVVPEGQPFEKHISITLDPSNQQKRRKRRSVTESYTDSIDDTQNVQVTAINLTIPHEAVPGTETCFVSAIGDQFGPTVETCLENPDILLAGPKGCAEQNIIRFAPTLYTVRYLKSTRKLTKEMEVKGYDLLRKGYGHQLNYRKNDGSFGTWKSTPSSVWLTAFVTKVMCQAGELIYIDSNVMCQGIRWLLTKQNLRGSFRETYPVSATAIMGGVNGEGSLTAYVLLTLETCQCNIEAEIISKTKAVQFLESILSIITEPLPIAITTYALAIANSVLKHEAKRKLLALKKYDPDRNTLHWGSGTAAANIEATSYALLALLQFKDMEKCNAIVNWLNTQRYYSGRYESTQDTVVALHALSEYAIQAKTPSINLVSNITLSKSNSFSRTVSFNESNAQTLREIVVNDFNGATMFVNTTGHGISLLSVKLRYNVAVPPEKICKFDISVNVSDVKDKGRLRVPFLDELCNDNTDIIPRIEAALELQRIDRPIFVKDIVSDAEPSQHQGTDIKAEETENAASIKNVKICVRYRGVQYRGMTIVDVGVFTGFAPVEQDLIQLQKCRKITFVDRYEKSDRGVVFYLEKVPHNSTMPHCFQFHIIQEYRVANTQPSAIKVYDYYNPDQFCSRFYALDNCENPTLLTKCDGRNCQCVERRCPPKNPFSDKSLSALLHSACEEHDYVWKGKVVTKEREGNGFIIMKILVQEVLKEGTESADTVEGEERLFMARENCETVEFLVDKQYFIMGKDGETYWNEDDEINYRYMLDKSTKIEMWVENSKGPNKRIRNALIWLSRKLKREGCKL